MRNLPTAYLSLLLAGCTPATQKPIATPPPMIEAARIEEPAPKPITPPVDGELVNDEPPEVLAAFSRYLKTGKAPLIDKSKQGFVQFPFGLSQPTVRCRPLELCDIELAPGEEILDLAAGDQERWVFQPLRSGPPEKRIVHVMAKPTDTTSDMETTIVIGTNLRTYRIRLISRLNGAIRHARFYYPEELIQRFNAGQAIQRQEQQDVAGTAINLESLDDSYSIEGNTSWTPTWVANDGTRTYIKMPPTMRTTDAPALFVQTENGDNTLLNYRLRGNYYVADRLFDRAVLIWGVGKDKQTVTISRTRR